MKIATQIGIVGGGSWASAICKVIQSKSEKINWWIRQQDSIDFMLEYKHNPNYLSSIEFNTDLLNLSSNLEDIIKNSDIIFFSIPAAFLHTTLKDLDKKILENKIVISAIKGFIPEYNITISEYFKTVFNVPIENFGLLAGPCHAEEVVMEKLSYITAASINESIVEMLENKLSTHSTKIIRSTDIQGLEYSSALKNIYAVAAGISVGLGFGDNFLSVLTTNSIMEMKNFLDSLSKVDRNVCCSSYSGDLIVTIYSQFSRNRAFGTMIGKGYSVNYSKIEMKQVAEGYYAAKCMNEILKNIKADMPIAKVVYEILYENKSPLKTMKILSEKLH